ncbi:MAG: hypothetical protein C0415_05975 [Thermodesulfovibrio sp.]|nr:hypothetical protein [Thermodesulfovibrio sp.]
MRYKSAKKNKKMSKTWKRSHNTKRRAKIPFNAVFKVYKQAGGSPTFLLTHIRLKLPLLSVFHSNNNTFKMDAAKPRLLT